MGQSAKGHRLIPDYPKIATWGDAYYVSFNLGVLRESKNKPAAGDTPALGND